MNRSLKKVDVAKDINVLIKTETRIKQMSGAVLSVRNALLYARATMSPLLRAHAGKDRRMLTDTLQTEMERSLNLLADENTTHD